MAYSVRLVLWCLSLALCATGCVCVLRTALADAPCPRTHYTTPPPVASVPLLYKSALLSYYHPYPSNSSIHASDTTHNRSRLEKLGNLNINYLIERTLAAQGLELFLQPLRLFCMRICKLDSKQICDNRNQCHPHHSRVGRSCILSIKITHPLKSTPHDQSPNYQDRFLYLVPCFFFQVFHHPLFCDLL